MKRTILAICIVAIMAFGTVSMGADYFPLIVDNTWTYDLQILSNNGIATPAGEATYTITGDTAIDGNTYHVLEVDVNLSLGAFNMDSSMTLFAISIGNDVIATPEVGNESKMFKLAQHQYQEGDEWTPGNATVSISEYGSITVPAGTFENCWAARSDQDSINVFAPDVGLVERIGQFSSFTVRFALSSYNVEVPQTGIHRANLTRGDLSVNMMLSVNNLLQTITVNLGDQHAKLDIFRADGKLLNAYELGGTGTIPVDRTGLSSGNVFVRLRVGDKQYTGKLSIAK